MSPFQNHPSTLLHSTDIALLSTCYWEFTEACCFGSCRDRLHSNP